MAVFTFRFGTFYVYVCEKGLLEFALERAFKFETRKVVWGQCFFGPFLRAQAFLSRFDVRRAVFSHFLVRFGVHCVRPSFSGFEF